MMIDISKDVINRRGDVCLIMGFRIHLDIFI